MKHVRNNLSPRKIPSVIILFIYLILFPLLWSFLINVFSVPDYIIPPPLAVGKSLLELPEYYFENFITTFTEAGIGLFAGFIIGFILGVILRYTGIVGKFLTPPILASQVFPIFSIAPILLVYFGFGLTPKIIVSAIICLFPSVINTLKGLEELPEETVIYAKSIGCSGIKRFFFFDLPFSIPYIMAALRMCAPYSIVGAIVGEFVGSSKGLGHIILSANADMAADRVYASLILCGILGGLFYGFAIIMDRIVFKKYSRLRLRN